MNSSDLRKAINQHIDCHGVEVIEGTFQGQPVLHFVDPATGINVIADRARNFISGWKLNPDQLKNVLNRGSL